MRTTYIVLALLCGASLAACGEPTAAVASRDLDLTLPPIQQTVGAVAAVGGGEYDDPPPPRESDVPGVPHEDPPQRTPSDTAGADTLPPEPLPEGIPEELLRPATILTYWTNALINSGYAWGIAFMEYIAAAAEQTLTLNLSYKRRPLTTVAVTEAQSFFLPVHAKVKTTAAIPVTETCGLALLALGSHIAKNEFQVFSRPFLLSKEQVGSQDDEVQPACPEDPPPPPPTGNPGSGGDGPAPEGAAGETILDCWWLFTYVGNELVDVEPISCQLIS